MISVGFAQSKENRISLFPPAVYQFVGTAVQLQKNIRLSLVYFYFGLKCVSTRSLSGRLRARGLVREAMLLLGSSVVCGVSTFITGSQRISNVPTTQGHAGEKTRQFGPCLYL